jgi:Zn finger protein HypA/HybF involved in hydrogenase expression
MEYPNQIVHCLECDTTYPEQQPVVKSCPDCGNDNMGLTVYLQGETKCLQD